MANPIGLLLTAIALIAGLIIANWDKVGPFFVALWESIKIAAVAVWDFIKMLVTAVADHFKWQWESVKMFVTAIWDALKWLWQAWVDANMAALRLLGDFFKAIWSGISNFFTSIWDHMKSVATSGVTGIKSVMSTISEHSRGVRSKVSDWATKAWKWLTDAWDKAPERFVKIGLAILDGLTYPFRKIWDTARRTMNFLKGKGFKVDREFSFQDAAEDIGIPATETASANTQARKAADKLATRSSTQVQTTERGVTVNANFNIDKLDPTTDVKGVADQMLDAATMRERITGVS